MKDIFFGFMLGLLYGVVLQHLHESKLARMGETEFFLEEGGEDDDHTGGRYGFLN